MEARSLFLKELTQQERPLRAQDRPILTSGQALPLAEAPPDKLMHLQVRQDRPQEQTSEHQISLL